MRPLSQDAAKRLALAHGAKLEIDGKAVNAARLQVVAPGAPRPPVETAYMPEKTAPEPVKTIAPEPDPALREAVLSVQDAVQAVGIQTAQVVQGLRETMQQIAAKEPDKRPAQWVFKVKRDAQGLMETITATAVYK